MATLILKATEDCNSDCIYCDVVKKRRSVLYMPLETLEMVFIRINEFLKNRPNEKFTIIWHGGEPLLLGPEYFQSAWDFQEKHCSETKYCIEHAIQSNLTLFSEKFVPILKKLGIDQIGSSFDPEPYVRGSREKKNNFKYNHMFMMGDALIQRYGFGSGIIYVVTKKSLNRPLDVFFFLTNLKTDGAISFNPVLIYNENHNEIAISPEEYVEFLGAIFPTWWNHRNRYPNVEPFRSLLKIIAKGEISLGCVDSGMCAYSHINVSPDGEASHCGRSYDWGILPYGNISKVSFLEIFSDRQRQQLLDRNKILQKRECKNCRFWTICHGGCPLDSWAKHKDFMHKTEWCDSKRGFIEKYFEPITGLRFEPDEK